MKRKSRKQIKQEIRENATITEDGMSYDEIAAILGISKSEVRRIEYQALRKLKIPTELNKKLKSYAEGNFGNS
jgi:DNA-directed RNA polymerase sigma subunit (sigma70/sigma32)